MEGFKPHIDSTDDAALFARLHHFPWRPELKTTGNDGGHFGTYQHDYLRGYVLPALCAHNSGDGGLWHAVYMDEVKATRKESAVK